LCQEIIAENRPRILDAFCVLITTKTNSEFKTSRNPTNCEQAQEFCHRKNINSTQTRNRVRKTISNVKNNKTAEEKEYYHEHTTK
jgi:hypothetical protein